MTSDPPESMWMDLDFLEMEMEASLIKTESLILELGEKEYESTAGSCDR
jgi:hypothetical protein